MNDWTDSELTDFLETGLSPTRNTKTRFYSVWIHTLTGESKHTEIQAESDMEARYKAINFYRTADRILVVVP